jgi:hypothetical protein
MNSEVLIRRWFKGEKPSMIFQCCIHPSPLLHNDSLIKAADDTSVPSYKYKADAIKAGWVFVEDKNGDRVYCPECAKYIPNNNKGV